MEHPFEYQKPTDLEVARMEMIRNKCRLLHEELLCLPSTRERSLAITNLEQVSMWANKAVVLHGSNLPTDWVISSEKG